MRDDNIGGLSIRSTLDDNVGGPSIMFTLDVGVPVSEDEDDGDGGVVHPPGVYE
jgi:hypothetical protein